MFGTAGHDSKTWNFKLTFTQIWRSYLANQLLPTLSRISRRRPRGQQFLASDHVKHLLRYTEQPKLLHSYQEWEKKTPRSRWEWKQWGREPQSKEAKKSVVTSPKHLWLQKVCMSLSKAWRKKILRSELALLCINSPRDCSSCKVSKFSLQQLNETKSSREHLYEHHRIFPCQRCKKLFRNQQEVNEHLKEAQGCALIEGIQHDGLTSEAVERLRSKKKAYREQTKEER